MSHGHSASRCFAIPRNVEKLGALEFGENWKEGWCRSSEDVRCQEGKKQ
jgi:hypothetical protein